MIGKHYSRNQYNCAHFVMDYYGIKTDLNTFDLDFVKWMRSNFKEVIEPKHDDLVVITNQDGSLHVGIYQDNSVLHNYSPSVSAKGSVVRTPLTILKTKHKVRFYRWLKSNTSSQ